MTYKPKSKIPESAGAKTAIIYYRVSDYDQLKGLSLETQRKACSEYAKKNGNKVAAMLGDEAKTGTTTAGRQAFEEAIIRCQREHVNALLVIDTDRFARNETDHYLTKSLLEKYGTKLIAVNQPMINDTPEGRFLEAMLIGQNAFASRLTGKKVKMSLDRKFEEGTYPSMALPGYKNVNTGTEDKPIRIIDVDVNNGPLMAEAFEVFSSGCYSIAELCKVMYAKGLKTKKGKMMSTSSMQSYLTNPFYYGLMRWHGDTKMGNHKPLITKALFDQVQFVLSKHRHFLVRQRKYSFLLRGFVFCPIHNRRLTADWHKITRSKKRSKIAYYHCTMPRGCKSSCMESEDLEKQVGKLLKRFEFSPKFIEIIRNEVKRYYEECVSTIKSEVQGLINKKRGLENKRDEVERLLISGDFDRDTYKRRHDELEVQITQVDVAMAEAQNKRNIDMDLIEEVLALSRNIYQTYCEAPDFLKRHYLRFFFEGIFIKDQKIAKVAETPILSELKKQQQVFIAKNWLGEST